MKFNIGDKFYIFETFVHISGFNVREYKVNEILIRENNISMFKDCDTKWFSEKECLTKEEMIQEINIQIKKI